MINNYLTTQIKGFFHYKPTIEQENTINFLSEFLVDRRGNTVFVLKGYAGTGKTSLIGALVKTLDALKQKTILLAPTGRAAKVFSRYSEHTAFTIHKRIYRQKSFSNEMTNFLLDNNLNRHTLFIVDEASMISNRGLSGSVFGTGRLLDDLIHYVYSGEGCRLLLIGDTAQLPPVGEKDSPALSVSVLEGYGLKVYLSKLTEVVRQSQESGILYNATVLRQNLTNQDFSRFPEIRIRNFPDIQIINGSDLIEKINNCYDEVGIGETMIVTRSNKRANIYNNGIRGTILFRTDELNSGDLLMIAKNNYFWAEKMKELDFIANGDIAVVKRVRREQELYGFRFCDVLLSFPDFNDLEIEVKLLLDTLQTEAPALTGEENDKLFYSVLEDYADIPRKAERMKKMKADPFYNALQVKYAYAVTCHKAQGGQWKRVFLDQGYVTDEMLGPDYFRWIYTAFTRATETLYLVNWPKEQIENENLK
ncbi:ATP-dependent DNA helicase [Phocaeicola oris]|uniref:ATP-dependent DNA helicase n=1 Tax=Phocaeicola oris TaxID=2896850 RepID=UPI00234F0AA7|nr:AAA family ATPase [Phocaeicola oris]MCE2616796.1 AAA family ATPase [Phocaeicola oris]